MPDQFTELLKMFFSNSGATVSENAPETILVFQSAVQWAAIALSALAGVSEARRREPDFLGARA